MYLCQYISEDVNASYTADIAFWSMVIFFSCIKSRLKQLRERLHVASEIRIYTCGFNTGTGRLTKAILQFFNWPQTVLFNLFLFFFFFEIRQNDKFKEMSPSLIDDWKVNSEAHHQSLSHRWDYKLKKVK